MKRRNTYILIEIALCAALAMLLDFIPSPPGLKLSIKMMPILVLAFRRGLGAGFTGGFLWGLLQIVLGDAEILTLLQAFTEYFLAFAMIGMAGILSHKLHDAIKSAPTSLPTQLRLVITGTIIGSLSRYFIHWLAGVWFWGQYAPEGQSPYIYSLTVNGMAFLTETLCCIAVFVIAVRFYRTLFIPKH